jgi:hypothetical protein
VKLSNGQKKREEYALVSLHKNLIKEKQNKQRTYKGKHWGAFALTIFAVEKQ